MDAARRETYARYDPYLETYVEVSLVDDKVTSVTFPDNPDPEAGEDHNLLDRIEDYLSGTARDDFTDVPVELSGSPTERAVFETVRALPYGENASIEQLVRSLDGLDADRHEDHDLVREILDGNPIPLIVPDHRVRDGPSGAPPAVEQRLRSLEQIGT